MKVKRWILGLTDEQLTTLAGRICTVGYDPDKLREALVDFCESVP